MAMNHDTGEYLSTDPYAGSYVSTDPNAGTAYTGGSKTFDESGAGPGAGVPIPSSLGYQTASGGGLTNEQWAPAPQQGGGTPQQTGGGSVESILRSIDPNNWAAGFAARENDLKALGYTLQRNSNGDVRGRLYNASGQAYDPFQQYGWATSNTGSNSGTLGGFYGSMWNRVPTQEEAMHMPGIQFALDRTQRGVERSAAAKGTLLTGGTLRDLADYTTGTALNQGYIPLANLQNSTNQLNAGNLYNLAQLGQNSSSYGATGRPA